MFDLRFSIRDLRPGRSQSLRSWSGTTPLKNRVWEVEIYRDAYDHFLTVAELTKQNG